MNKFILVGVTTAALAIAQDAASTPPASPDMENLRQQMQALTETVKALQQQVKDQQTTIDRLSNNNGAPTESAEPSPIAAASPSPSPAASAAPHFATEDASVVSSTSNTPPAPSGPGVNANGTAVSGN